MYSTNEKTFQKNNISSNEAIKFFGSRRFLWVGWKGETNKLTMINFFMMTVCPQGSMIGIKLTSSHFVIFSENNNYFQ
jgi:hypothetical protein